MKSPFIHINWWDLCFQLELILHIRKELDEGNLPADVASSLEELYYNYKNAVKTGAHELCSIFNLPLPDGSCSCLASVLFYQVLQNGDPNAYEIMLSNMMALFDRVLLDVQVRLYILVSFIIWSESFIYVPRWPLISSFILLQNPFTFPPYHKAIREPFDYYMFGQNYIRPLVDFR